MQLQTVNGKQVGFHKAFNYLYRPIEMEHMPLNYKYYSETKFISMSEVRKLGVEHSDYTEKHLFRQSEAVVLRTAAAVPSFPWNWLGSTKCFLTSLFHPTDKDATDHHKKEEYAFRFMLLFVPFRSKEDLETDGCFQNALQRAHKDGLISGIMIQIAENIQTIHNSLASGIPENTLSAETTLVEAPDFENMNEGDDNEDYENLLASIGELFTTLTNGEGLKEDSKTLDIGFGNKQMEAESISRAESDTVIDLINPEDGNLGSRQKVYPTKRFCSTTSNLNTLVLQTRITRTQANEHVNDEEKAIIDANGTWQSISKWGENEGLDGEQQTAFEILAAMYVLSFYNEAKVDTTILENYEGFIERKMGLCKLARWNMNDEQPLCMFITGPAGAGKCKSR